MKTKLLAIGALVGALGLVAVPQETPKAMSATYGALADSILALKRTETSFVLALLEGHFQAARSHYEGGMGEMAAAEMALFASEGDNSIAGVRKRLLEGGHHHHADDEAKGVYEPGFVVVTKAAKEGALQASAAMRRAKTDAEREAAWKQFTAVAEPLLRG
ncbi:MAG: hypothetical protein AB1726_13415 [Planctomycetota bacterium]